MADYQSPDGLLLYIHGWQCAVGRGIHSQRKKRWLHRWIYDKVISMVAAPAQIKHTRTPVAPKKMRQSTAALGTTEFKGTVARDFLPLVFFTNRPHIVPEFTP